MSTFPVTPSPLSIAFGCVLALASSIMVWGPALAQGFTPGRYGIGTPAPQERISALDVDIMGDGRGLPEGAGTYDDGAALYVQLCMDCHGETLVGGRERGGALIGGRGTLNSEFPRRTVESYWPYAPTLFDYIRRAMPYTAPGSLEPDQVYALIAFILAEAAIIGKTETVNAANLPLVEMPNWDGFRTDWPPEMFR